MLDDLETLFGTTYADNPVGFVICSCILLWIIYQVFSIAYKILGGK